MISQDDARQDPSGHRTLYVLGFGIAGAILSNSSSSFISLCSTCQPDASAEAGFFKASRSFQRQYNTAPIRHH